MCFNRFRANPSVLTQLTVTHDGDDATMDNADESREYPCLVRVTDGKEAEFSTHVRIFPEHMPVQTEPPIATDYIRETG